ncbi:MAG TPA: Type 1 glutamine amidotransferase-like domain-containing protein [Candidatus Saccharimonadales bacterium]|nr:Type 1 glutamine amidotransferase-like domain-containing protein [Candidatus Saccharimonadales bacterium]
MTKYVLHGGLAKDKAYKQDFFDEIVSTLSQKSISVLYLSARINSEKKGEKTKQKQEEFRSFLPKKDITVVMVDENPEKFLDQTHAADIVYFGGGDTQQILNLLRQIPLDILSQHLQNKIVVGVSAGANALSKYYFSAHRQQIEEGLGVLPIKVFCHYTEEKEQLLANLEAYGEQLTSFALPEDYFVIIQ